MEFFFLVESSKSVVGLLANGRVNIITRSTEKEKMLFFFFFYLFIENKDHSIILKNILTK